MNYGRTLFSQVMDFVPWTSFERIVTRHRGDVRVRSLRRGEQFRIMAFAQRAIRRRLSRIRGVCVTLSALRCQSGTWRLNSA
ncbi:DUF4372 domain-containing protein [Methylocystis sp. H62]|nr:DUF4372 domain-containing protein [Methylocystis sp. H62]MBG0792448.1 DUF4372 domain-containing protein [Methylocystis sp. H62]MBG0792902.1 DUF4372 domain-containing protein [Methylocystis sp. H62]